MTWGRLDDPAWWWEYALDGVIGGIVAGLVTGLAVWLTLRHERKLAAEAVERAAIASDRADGRALALRVQSSTLRLVFAFERLDPTPWSPNGPTDPEVMHRVESLAEDALSLTWVLNNRWPRTSEMLLEELSAFLDLVEQHEIPADDALSEALTEMHATASAWTQDPASVEANPRAVTTPRRGARGRW